MENFEENSVISDQNLNKDLYSLIRKNTFYVFFERLISPVINFLLIVFIIRKLSVDEYGIYLFLISMMGYINLLSSLGIPGVFQRFLPEFYQKGEIDKLRQLVNKGLIWRCALSSGIILILILFSGLIGHFFKVNEFYRFFQGVSGSAFPH